MRDAKRSLFASINSLKPVYPDAEKIWHLLIISAQFYLNTVASPTYKLIPWHTLFSQRPRYDLHALRSVQVVESSKMSASQNKTSIGLYLGQTGPASGFYWVMGNQKLSYIKKADLSAFRQTKMSLEFFVENANNSEIRLSASSRSLLRGERSSPDFAASVLLA